MKKWWKNRNFQIQFIDDLKNTPLGGVYGDVRDKRYVMSYSYFWKTINDDWFFYKEFVNIYRNISFIVNELRVNENK